MSDGTENVDVNLDDFEKEFYGKAEAKPVEKEVVEAPEDTSATEPEQADELPAEEADGDDAPANEDEPEAEAIPQKKGKSPRERIEELNAKFREEQRRADALQRELDAAKTAPPRETRNTEPTPLDPKAPTPDDTLENGDLAYPLGEFDPRYIRDLTRFTIQEENAAAKVQNEEERQRSDMVRAEQELAVEWAGRLDKAAESDPEYKDKIATLEDKFVDLDPEYGKYLATTIMSLEYGPEVLGYLADNPDEARRIADAGPTRATIALGRIEANFVNPPDSKVARKVVTAAPTPPPTNRGSSGKAGVAADTDDLDAFEKQFYAK